MADIVQRIEAVVRDPLDRRELVELLECLGAASAAGQAAFLELLYQPATARRLLTAAEAAQRMGVSPRWMYDHQHQMLSRRPLSKGRLRFDSVDLESDMARRR